MAPKKKPYSQLSKTAKYYRDNPTARKKKASTDKKVNSRPEQKSKRVELVKKNREADKRGINRNGRDYDHAVGGYVKSSTNRGRAEKSRLKGSKRYGRKK